MPFLSSATHPNGDSLKRSAALAANAQAARCHHEVASFANFGEVHTPLSEDLIQISQQLPDPVVSAVDRRVPAQHDRKHRAPLDLGVKLVQQRLDIAGLLTLLRTHDRARACAFELVVARPRGMANRVFTLTRAGEALSMVE